MKFTQYILNENNTVIDLPSKEVGDWKVFDIKTAEEWEKIAVGTMWATENIQHYLDKGPVYVFISKDGEKKYGYSKGAGEVYDKMDRAVDDFFETNKDLAEYK